MKAGKVVVLDVGWRVRFRMWRHHLVNRAGCWLVGHRMIWAARLLWRV